MIFAPASVRVRERAADERGDAARRNADDDVPFRRAETRDAARAFLVIVFDPSFARNTASCPPAMSACTSRVGVPNVGGISAASNTPRRPLVPAPMRMMRPPLRSACVTISIPCAIRSFSLWTAATTFLSSLTINSMMSATGALSRARLAGLIASVGRNCHFEAWASPGRRRYSAYPWLSIRRRPSSSSSRRLRGSSRSSRARSSVSERWCARF